MSDDTPAEAQRPSGLRALQRVISRAEDRVETALKDRRVEVAAVGTAAAAVAALRLSATLTLPAAGPDYGHFLIAANWYTGQDHSGSGPFDPPIMALVLALLRALFGPLVAVQALGPIATAALVPAAFWFLERFIPRWAALASACVFSMWQGFSELSSFGGATNLFGMAFSIVFFRLLFEVLEKPRAGWKPDRLEWWCIAALVAVVSSHHLTTFITGATTLVWVGLRTLQSPQRKETLWTGARIALFAALISLPYAPYLISIAQADAGGGFGSGSSSTQLTEAIAFLWRYNSYLWGAFAAFAALALVTADRRAGLTAGLVSLLITPVLLVTTILGSHPVRVPMYLAFPVVALAATWLARGAPRPALKRLHKAAPTALRAAAAVLTVTSVVALGVNVRADQLEQGAFYQRNLTPLFFDTLGWISANTGPTDVIAVGAGPSEGYADAAASSSIGWWVEGYANRAAVFSANPTLLPFKRDWAEAQDANRYFAGDYGFEDGVLRTSDSFPYDDWAGPKVFAAYMGDYHFLTGLAAPRLIDRANQSIWWLQGSAVHNVTPELSMNTGFVNGSYAGPDFMGTRDLRVDGSTHEVTVTTTLTLNASAPWDVFRATVYVPLGARGDLGRIASGAIEVGYPSSGGFTLEVGEVQFTTAGLSPAVAFEGSAIPNATGYEVEWNLTARSFSHTAKFRLLTPPFGNPESQPLALFFAPAIADARSFDYVLIRTDLNEAIRRLSLDPDRYTKVFDNGEFVIYNMHRPL